MRGWTVAVAAAVALAAGAFVAHLVDDRSRAPDPPAATAGSAKAPAQHTNRGSGPSDAPSATHAPAKTPPTPAPVDAPPAPQPVQATQPARPVEVPIRVLADDGQLVTEPVFVLAMPRDGVATSRLAFRWAPESPTIPLAPGRYWITARWVDGMQSAVVQTVVSQQPTEITIQLRPTPPAGEPKPRDVIVDALAWLARQQKEDGSWGDPAATGLAVLAFVTRGETHQAGPHSHSIRDALKQLRGLLRPDGSIGDSGPNARRDQAIVALAFVESYAVTASRVFREPAERALAHAVASLAAADGPVDLDALAWTALLVGAAQAAKLPVEDGAMRGIQQTLERITHPHSGRVEPPLTSAVVWTPNAATVLGIFVRGVAGEPEEVERRVRATAFLSANPPASAESVFEDPRFAYFGALAASRSRKDAWEKWTSALDETVVAPLAAEIAAGGPAQAPPPDGFSALALAALRILTVEARFPVAYPLPR